MFSKTNRLAKDKDIAAAFARGRGFFNPFFTIKYLPKIGEKRFTVVVSTKVLKKATARNRLKRLLREYLRKNLFKFRDGHYLIIVKPKISRLPETQKVSSFLEICAKIR